jgi:hypothetical protein
MPHAPYDLSGKPFVYEEKNNNGKSFESENLAGSEPESLPKRRSISTNGEKRKYSHEKKEEIEKDYEEKNKEKEEEKEGQKISEEHLKSDEDEENKRREEKLERKRLRKQRRESKKKMSMEMNEVVEIENHINKTDEIIVKRDSSDGISEIVNSPIGIYIQPQDGPAFENVKSDVGCGICSAFKTVSQSEKSCIII